MGLIKTILFIQNPDAINLSEEILSICELLVLPAFMIALIAEYFRGMNFHKPIAKLIVALLGFYFFIPIHTNAVELGFDFSDQILSKYGKENSFAKRYDRAIAKSDKEEHGIFYRALFTITGATNHFAGIFLNLSSFFFLFILKYIYSIIYHLTIILFGVSAIISFLPISEGSLAGHLKASLWCTLMPVVVCFILVLISGSDTLTLGTDAASNGIINGVLNFISLLLTSVCILISPIITMKLIDGAGIHSAAGAVAKMATYSAISQRLSGFQSLQGGQGAANQIGNTQLNTPNFQMLKQIKPQQKIRSVHDSLKGKHPHSHLTAAHRASLDNKPMRAQGNYASPRVSKSHQSSNSMMGDFSKKPKETYTSKDLMLGKSRRRK